MEIRSILCGLAVCIFISSGCENRVVNDTEGIADTTFTDPAVNVPTLSRYDSISAQALKFVGVVETHENCSPEIKLWASRIGLHCPIYWCAVTCHEVHYLTGYPTPGKSSAYSPSWFPSKRVYWRKGGDPDSLKIGTEVGFYFTSKKRIAHIGIITGRQSGALLVTEGNASVSQHTRNGTAVVVKFRQPWEIHAAADWTY